jgi:hypothetical protein
MVQKARSIATDTYTVIAGLLTVHAGFGPQIQPNFDRIQSNAATTCISPGFSWHRSLSLGGPSSAGLEKQVLTEFTQRTTCISPGFSWHRSLSTGAAYATCYNLPWKDRLAVLEHSSRCSLACDDRCCAAVTPRSQPPAHCAISSSVEANLYLY